MYYGICLLSIVPCRKEASNASEMVTQLLFGEHYSVVDQTETWLKIISAYDKYECWLNIKQHTKISEATFKSLESKSLVIVTEINQAITNKTTGLGFPVLIGSTLPGYSNKECKVEDFIFGFEGKTFISNVKKTTEELLATAKLFLNAPYLWGGKNIFGIDCSGFTQLVYKLNGYKLPRDAWQQAELGSPLNFVEEAQPGDLAFFDNEEGKIVHVGIILSNNEIIHASGKVRIDKFDHYGIFHSENKKYSHMLRVIKRIS
ncbi:MAG TPA: C40 family peptidase [Bacteroidia bacterium]|nr:C40 family peptidase [Bacteroidia bacterium]